MERHVVEISRIKMEKAQLEQRVSVHAQCYHCIVYMYNMYTMLIIYYNFQLSEPQEALIRDREQLEEENAKVL